VSPVGVERLAGANRFATAARISAATFEPGVPVAYVATGGNYPDALAGGAAAARAGGPVLLTTPDGLPAETAAELARLQPGRIVVLGGTAAVSDTVLAQLGTYAPTSRTAGPDRFATAARTSAATFAPGVPVAYVATGGNYPDALAGGAAAARYQGPVLLTTTHALPAETAQELGRLMPGRIVVLGGPAAVSDAVLTQLRAYAPANRTAGADRFSTAAQLSAETFPTADTVFVATGGNYPDALAGSAAAATVGAPVLLVTADAVPGSVAAELTRLRPRHIVVLGGPAAVAEAVLADLRGFLR
jgi:putative cell wall-binding protein